MICVQCDSNDASMHLLRRPRTHKPSTKKEPMHLRKCTYEIERKMQFKGANERELARERERWKNKNNKREKAEK